MRVAGRVVPLVLVRHPRGRRLVLRLGPDGSARVTVPRGSSWEEAQRFAERHTPWLEKQLIKLASRPGREARWSPGTRLLFRGVEQVLEVRPAGDPSAPLPTPVVPATGMGTSNGLACPPSVCLGSERIAVVDAEADLRAEVERHLWALARRELPLRVLELAAADGLQVERVTVRDQRSRWGSCSRRRTLSLNWRLIQTPPAVSDYILWHELMHLREMNHSARFWREVERVCPVYREAEQWLRRHSWLLR